MKTSKSTLTVAREALEADRRVCPNIAIPRGRTSSPSPSCSPVWWSRNSGAWTTAGSGSCCSQARILGKRTPLATIDSTGLESRHVSTYYTKRCQRHNGHSKSRYPKLSAVGDTASHLILGWGIDRGPQPDPTEARPTVRDALSHQSLGALLGDPGYEGEGFHRFCRGRHIRSIIPTTDRGRPRADGRLRVVRGRYRKLMKSHFPKVLYGQRGQAETLNSMLKRNSGSARRARSYHSQNREIRLRILTPDLSILLRPVRHGMSH